MDFDQYQYQEELEKYKNSINNIFKTVLKELDEESYEVIQKVVQDKMTIKDITKTTYFSFYEGGEKYLFSYGWVRKRYHEITRKFRDTYQTRIENNIIEIIKEHRLEDEVLDNSFYNRTITYGWFDTFP